MTQHIDAYSSTQRSDGNMFSTSMKKPNSSFEQFDHQNDIIIEEQEVTTPFQDQSATGNSQILQTTKSERDAIDAFMDDKLDSPEHKSPKPGESP